MAMCCAVLQIAVRKYNLRGLLQQDSKGTYALSRTFYVSIHTSTRKLRDGRDVKKIGYCDEKQGESTIML